MADGILLTRDDVSAAIRDKTPTGTPLKAAQIAEEWDAQARQRAMFSARVTQADILAGFQRRIQQVVDGKISREQARDWMTRLLESKGDSVLASMGFMGVNDARQGSIQELASQSRLLLIVDQNVMMAHATSEYQKRQELKQFKPFVEYRTAEDGRVRDSHAVLDKKIFKVDSNEAAICWPPNGFRCRCRMMPRTEDEVKGRKVEDMIPPDYLEAKAEDPDPFSFDPRNAQPNAMQPRSDWSQEAVDTYVKGTIADIDVEHAFIQERLADWTAKAEKAKSLTAKADALEAVANLQGRLKGMEEERAKVQAFQDGHKAKQIAKQAEEQANADAAAKAKAEQEAKRKAEEEAAKIAAEKAALEAEAKRIAAAKPKDESQSKLRADIDVHITRLNELDDHFNYANKKLNDLKNERKLLLEYLQSSMDVETDTEREFGENDQKTKDANLVFEEIQKLYRKTSQDVKRLEEDINKLETLVIKPQKEKENKLAIEKINKLGELVLKEGADNTREYPKDSNGNDINTYRDRSVSSYGKCQLSEELDARAALSVVNAVKETNQEAIQLEIPALRGIKSGCIGGSATMGDGVLAINDTDFMIQYEKNSNIKPSEYLIGDDKSINPKIRPSVSIQHFNRGDEVIRSAVNHEFGHHIHQTSEVADEKTYYKHPKDFEARLEQLFNAHGKGESSASEYAKDNHLEWWAENYAYARMNRWDLVDPALFEMIMNLLKL